METILNNETLKLARNYMGYSQKAFASWLDVSQALISNIEKSRKPLESDLTEKLIDRFGETFFSQKMYVPNLKVYYRASSTVAKKLTDLFEARLQIISNNISELLEYVNINENKIPKLDLDDYQHDAKFLANEVRNNFNLGNRPIENFVGLLEKLGVIVYFFDYDFISTQNKNFDGVSFYVSGVPVILINKKIQNARKIFTLAHELGHLIMHNPDEFYISKNRDIEKEANIFASEFIAPESALRGEFAYLNLDKLFLLKSYWKMSIGALLYKAKGMTLTNDQYRRWVTRLAPYRKHEPNDFDIENPILLKRMFEVTKNDIGNESDFYYELGISKYLFTDIYSTLLDKGKPKLRIIL